MLVLTAFGAAAQEMEIDRAARAMSGMEAGFTHRFTAKGFKNSQVESGSVIFGVLPAMRWTYARPEQKTFIFDGQTSWFYVPADKQVTLARVDAARKRELPFLLLGDPAARAANFVLREQKRGGRIVSTLQPKAAAAQIRSVTVTIDPARHLIERIDYTDRDGNQTSFQLSGYRRRATNAALFRFNPPAGVQVVHAN